MAMPMQISLDEVISMLLSRVEGLSLNSENDKTRFNIVLRVLYKKGIITDTDIEDSVREEHRMLKELGLIKEEPDDAAVKAVADSILQWARGDTGEIKRAMEDYERRLQEYAREQQQARSGIAVASSDVLRQLDKMAPPPGGGNGGRGGKLII